MAHQSRGLILILDGRPEIRELLCEVLEMAGYQVQALATLPTHPREIERFRPAVVILDHFRGAESPGLRFLRQLRSDPATRALPVLLCTAALAEVRQWERELAALCVAVIPRPFALDELIGAVRRAVGSEAASPFQPQGLDGWAPEHAEATGGLVGSAVESGSSATL